VDRPKISRRLIWLIAAVLLPYGAAVALGLLTSMSSVEVAVTDEIGTIPEFESDDAAKDFYGLNLLADSVVLYIQMTEFDPELSRAKFVVFPWPGGDLASRLVSSVDLNIDMRVILDSLDDPEPKIYESGDRVGAINVVSDVLSLRDKRRANDFMYPFDSYELDMYAFVDVKETKDSEWLMIPTIEDFYITPLSNFAVKYERTIFDWENLDDKPTISEIIDERKEGSTSFFVKFGRSRATYAISLLVAIFCIICSVALVWITLEVLRTNRPPSTQILIWAAATVLAEIQLRELLPGNPRIGIGFDFFILFPSLVIAVLVVLVQSGSWIRRSDFIP